MHNIQLVLHNKFGDFYGKKVEITDENYQKLLEMVKNFYVSGGFELTLEDGTFCVFPPNVVQDSILKVLKVEE
jgi:hypothetical protein